VLSFILKETSIKLVYRLSEIPLKILLTFRHDSFLNSCLRKIHWLLVRPIKSVLNFLETNLFRCLLVKINLRSVFLQISFNHFFFVRIFRFFWKLFRFNTNLLCLCRLFFGFLFEFLIRIISGNSHQFFSPRFRLGLFAIFCRFLEFFIRVKACNFLQIFLPSLRIFLLLQIWRVSLSFFHS
jgi:hypothetical protein